MYTDRNFKTKKQLREFFEAGKPVTVYQPGPFGMAAETGRVGQVRTCFLEGPHYPQAHTWYAQGEYEVCSMQMVTLKGSRAKWVNGVFVPAPVKQAIVKPGLVIDVPEGVEYLPDPPMSPGETIDRLVEDALEVAEIVKDFEARADWDDAYYWASRKHGLAMALGYLAGVDPYSIISPEDFEAAGRAAQAALKA